MYYVIFDHNLYWYCRSATETLTAVFHSSDDAYAYACHILEHEPTETDSWVVQRVMHYDTVIDPAVWSNATACDITPDYIHERLPYNLALFPTYDFAG